MSDAFFWILIFILSLAVLIKASDYFTQSAEQIGLNLGIPQYVIGVTIVSIGTSLPELISSVLAVTKGVPEVVAGNVVGSNIANIFLILACGAIFSKQRLRVEKSLLPVDLPAGKYMLVLGLYDIGDPSQRLPVMTETAVLDSWPISTILVEN